MNRSVTTLSRLRTLLTRITCITVLAGPAVFAQNELPATRGGVQSDDGGLRMGQMIEGRLPEVVDGRFDLAPIAAPSLSTEKVGIDGTVPESFRGDQPSPTTVLPETPQDRGLEWSWTVAYWAAPNTFSHPLYFQDRMLERHGQERCPPLTPILAGARFFTTVPMVPYLMGTRPPCECEYTMGYFRPGSCTPAYLQRPPYDRGGIIAESLAVSGAMIALP